MFGEWKCTTICIENKKYLDLCVVNVVGLGLLDSCLKCVCGFIVGF